MDHRICRASRGTRRHAPRSVGFLIIGGEGLVLKQGRSVPQPTDLSRGACAGVPRQKRRRRVFRAAPSLARRRRSGRWRSRTEPFEFMSQFDYSVPLTELCLVGALAMRSGRSVVWDSKKLEAVGNPTAANFIKRRAIVRAGTIPARRFRNAWRG